MGQVGEGSVVKKELSTKVVGKMWITIPPRIGLDSTGSVCYITGVVWKRCAAFAVGVNRLSSRDESH